ALRSLAAGPSRGRPGRFAALDRRTRLAAVQGRPLHAQRRGDAVRRQGHRGRSSAPRSAGADDLLLPILEAQLMSGRKGTEIMKTRKSGAARGVTQGLLALAVGLASFATPAAAQRLT